MKFFLGFFAIAGLCFAQSSAQEYNYNYNLAAPAPYGSAPSYQAPSSAYGQAPSYAPSAPTYSPPVYSAKPSYGPVRVGPATSYTYPSPSPPVPCPTNLLLSCQPSVAPVPCQSVQYAQASSYGAPSKPSYSAPAPASYR